ncbi:MAG: hypothetical protein CENE_02386 [Candidatus Celerinatantimonas neptuna]|nr:MAG: hypothetical protein CENE_02386 [Candidatus Celerinatantimonas neptuna]
MKIAIIGSGISGMTCAHLLSRHHEILLLEQNPEPGGHTATKTIHIQGQRFEIDTGFIVFNNRTYPLFNRLLNRIHIGRKETEMSFSVVNPTLDLQYNGHNLNTLFGQRRNLLRPWFYHFIYEVIRFNKQAKRATDIPAGISVGQFLEQHHFSDLFASNYLLPMGAAIWSASLNDIQQFSMRFFARFFNHHGLLDIMNRPQWYVIPGGSKQYIAPLLAECADKIRLNTRIISIERSDEGVTLTSQDHWQWQGDEVIFACHSEQALDILGHQATHQEQEILKGLRYQSNDVLLHQDVSQLPTLEHVKASWNYRLSPNQTQKDLPATVSYDMNRLQGLNSSIPFIVTLNPSSPINPQTILEKLNYEHPQFNNQTPTFQLRRHEINGKNHSWFCGAYWYNGFHEDGVRSAHDLSKALGGDIL